MLNLKKKSEDKEKKREGLILRKEKKEEGLIIITDSEVLLTVQKQVE